MDLLCGRQLSVVTSKEVRQSPLVKLLIGINDANLVAALNHPGRLTVEASLGVAHELILLFRHVVPPALQELLSLVLFLFTFLGRGGRSHACQAGSEQRIDLRMDAGRLLIPIGFVSKCFVQLTPNGGSKVGGFFEHHDQRVGKALLEGRRVGVRGAGIEETPHGLDLLKQLSCARHSCQCTPKKVRQCTRGAVLMVQSGGA